MTLLAGGASYEPCLGPLVAEHEAFGLGSCATRGTNQSHRHYTDPAKAGQAPEDSCPVARASS